jgi:hypothetical protein
MREVFGPGGGRGDTHRVLSGAVQDAARLRKEAAPLPNLFGATAKTISGQLNKALETSFRIANELKLLVGFGVLGGVAGLVAEGFKLNKEFEQFRITMGATVALTHDVVDATGRIVEGPQKLNFILGQTPKFFQEIRKLAAETLLEQNELVQTISENIGLAAQAGFKINTAQQRQQTFGVLANIAQLAKAIGLPGGQRQLTQEVRALLQGERLQGATIAKILGFTSGTEIARLQGQPSRAGNANRFIDELTARLKAAQPFLDQFKNSFSGLATTLISQGKEFLRLSFLPVFQRLVEVMKRLRDQFGDDAIQRGAQRIGEAMANIVDGIIRLGTSTGGQLFFKLFELLAANADKLLALFLSMKVLGGISALTGLQGAGGAAITGAGVGAGARAGGGLLKAGVTGIAGAIGTEGLLALGMPVGLLGAGAVVPGISAALGGGVALGTAAQAAGTSLGMRFPGTAQGGFFARPEIALPGEKAFPAGDPRKIIDAQIQQERSRQGRIRETLSAVRERGRTGFGPNVPGAAASLETLERAEAASAARIAERRKSLSELNLQMIAKEGEERRNETIKERLEARKALAEARRDREGELKAQLALDRFNIEQTVKDRAAAQKQQAAATARFLREITELRQDEYIKSKEQFATLTEDEIGQIRIRAEKDIMELRRRNVAASDFVRLRGAIMAKAARDESIQRLDQRDKQLGVQEATAKSFGQSIRAQAIATAQAGDATIKQRLRGEITEKEFIQRIRSLNFEYHESLRRQQQETHNKGIDLLQRFTNENKKQIDLRKQHDKELADLRERFANREKQLLQQRIDQERALTQAIKREREARQNLELGQEQRRLRQQIDIALRGRTFEQIERAHGERLRGAGLSAGEARGQARLAAERTVGEITGALMGGDLQQALGILGGLGVEVRGGQRQQLADLATTAGFAGMRRETIEQGREQEGLQAGVTEAERATADARRDLAETNREIVRLPLERQQELEELDKRYRQEINDNTLSLSRLGQEIRNFTNETIRAGIAIDQGLIAALARLTPLTGLGPRADQQIIGAAAALPVPGSGLQAGIREQVKGFRQEFFDTGNAFAQPIADIVNSPAAGGGSAVPTGPASITTNNFYSLDGVQLGSDTRELLEELGKKLQRDARRTP